MKFLILLVCLGFVAADLQERFAPVVDDAVRAFKEGMGKTGSLRRALQMPDAVELDEVEDVITVEVSNKLKEKLDKLLDKIKETIDAKKEVGAVLMEKLKDFVEKMKELKGRLGDKMKEKMKEVGDKMKDKFNDFLKRILEKMDARSLNEEYDRLARSKFSDIIESIKADILSKETLLKIREYIRKFVTNNPVLQAFKEFALKLKEDDFKQLMRDLLEHRRVESRAVRELWEKLKDWLKNVKVRLEEHKENFKKWLKEKLTKGFENIMEHYGVIKALAIEVMSHIKDIHGEAAKEAMEFFLKYKEDLGNIWEELRKKLKEQIGSS